MAEVVLGTYKDGFPLWPQHLRLKDEHIATHKHVMGVTGTGKSKLLEAICLQLIRQRSGVSFLDPHSTSVNHILANLIQMGFFKQPHAFQKLLFVEFTHEDTLFLPLNVLQQPHSAPDVIADDTLEAFHRAWPSLAGGYAAQFDTLVINGLRLLIENSLPLPALFPLILDEGYRRKLTEKIESYGVRAYFENFERLRQSEQADQSASTLRRINLLTSSPVLEYCLGQKENALNLRQLMDQGVCVLYDLGHVQNAQARRLLGCLLMVGYERAALSRLQSSNRTVHHLLIDEFSQFSAQSSDALSVMLSECRKAGLFATMAHQTWGQLGDRLHGALQNVGVKISLRIGREDAEVMAKWYGITDPMAVKFEPARTGQNPVTFSLQEQWESWINSLMTLPAREALVKVGDKPTVAIKTLTVPESKVDPQEVEEIKQEYRRLMRHKSEIVLPYEMPPDDEPPAIGRSAPRK